MSVRERLRDVDARPETAAAIAREGDPAALPELLAVYEEPVEAGRSALLKAMSALGGAAEGRRLSNSPDPEARRVAARLMSLLPEKENLPALEPLLTDADPDVADAARKALRHQWRTPDWHATVERLTASDDADLRATAEALRS